MAEAKAYARIDTSADDSVIDFMINAAVLVLEEYSNIGFVNRQVVCDALNPLGDLDLPLAPVTAISSVKDVDDNTINYIANDGVIVTKILHLKATYTAGHTTLPPTLKLALMMQVAWMYENRGDVQITGISPQAKAILKPIRRTYNEFFL